MRPQRARSIGARNPYGRAAGAKVAASPNDSCKLWLAMGVARESDEAAVWEGAALLARR